MSHLDDIDEPAAPNRCSQCGKAVHWSFVAGAWLHDVQQADSHHVWVKA